MPNDLRVEQCSALLLQVIKNMSGVVTPPAIENPEQVVSVATTMLKAGMDPLMGAISQVWADTIFSVRPAEKGYLRSLEMDLSRYGNATRKLSPISMPPIDNGEFGNSIAYNFDESTSPDGGNVDPWRIHKQYVQQTNFYGTATYAQAWTVFRDQLNTAFHSFEELSNFNAMELQRRYNDWELFREAVAETMQVNFIGALLKENMGGRIIHALSEYNAKTGEQFTAQDIYKPANFKSFVQWLRARIESQIKLMARQSAMWQTIVDKKPVIRHTPRNKVRIAMLSQFANEMDYMALANTKHDEYLSIGAYEEIPYWQDIADPDRIAVKPVYTAFDGAVMKAESAVEKSGVIALIHDVDALGYCITDTWQATTPININGGYWNTCNHAFIKTVQDQTEKAVLVVLD